MVHARKLGFLVRQRVLVASLQAENPTENGRFRPRNPSGWTRFDRQFRFPAISGQIDPSRTRSCHFWFSLSRKVCGFHWFLQGIRGLQELSTGSTGSAGIRRNPPETTSGRAESTQGSPAPGSRMTVVCRTNSLKLFKAHRPKDLIIPALAGMIAAIFEL